MRSLRSILVVQPYGIGDALFTTPLIRSLRTLPTVERIDLLLGSRTEAVFRNNPHVDEIHSIDKDHWHRLKKKELLLELLSLWKRLRGRYDLLVDSSLQWGYGFYAAFFLGIPRRIGFGYRRRDFFLTRSLRIPDGFKGKSAIDFYSELGGLLGLQVTERFPEFYVSDADRDEKNRRVGPERGSYVVVAPGGGESWGRDHHLRRWPVVNFSLLGKEIAKKLGERRVLILGSAKETELGEELGKELLKGSGSSLEIVNLAGKLSIGGTAAVLEKARLLIANDGGLVHLARALDTPTVAFYGPSDQAVYAPYPPSPRAVALFREELPCQPCYARFRYNSRCVDWECLTGLSPERVLEKLEQQNFWRSLDSR